MDFSFSDEQSLLADSVERFVSNDYSFEARQQLCRSELGFARENWRTFAELGWLGVPFPEADGGFGGSAVDTMILMEQFGKGLVVEPFLASTVLAGGILRHGANEAQKHAYLAPVIEGTRQGALAFAEPQGRFNLADLRTTAAVASFSSHSPCHIFC